MRTWLSAILLATLACDGGTSPSPPAYVAVSPQQKLLLERGSNIRFEARVADARGSAIAGAEVAWSVADPSVATIDANGQATAVATGGTEVRATAGDVSGTATLEVYIPPPIAEYLPGRTYFGRNRYVEYIPGDLPLVVSAGHGGGEEPDEIPRRTYGTLARDSWTQETTRAVRDSIVAYFRGVVSRTSSSAGSGARVSTPTGRSWRLRRGASSPSRPGANTIASSRSRATASRRISDEDSTWTCTATRTPPRGSNSDTSSPGTT